jgi:tetratricopeptide (TPR) repeat protein
VSGISYLDFDLKIERDGTRYKALVLSSPAGQASQSFDTPFSDLELENFLLRLGRPRPGVRRADSPEVVAVKKFGGELFGATFREEVLACLRSSMDEATRQKSGLRIRLHLTEVPELADLPWEFLYHPSMNRFLVLSDVTPVVRYLDMPELIQPHEFQLPLRVLVMISSPSDFPTLEVEKEWEKLHGALAELEQRGLVLLQRLDDATPAALRRRLRQDEFHVFHFIGHGGFDPNTQDGVLIMEDEQKRGRRMSGADIGMILHDHRPMRLAVLNACEGARASRSDPFGGTAQSLVQQGMPAVIAMQFEITDKAAITFAQEFYQALADNYPADAALAEARKAICDEGLVPEWGTPVLYLRAKDGKLFDVKETSAEDRGKVQAEALLRDGDSAAAQENWAVAAERYEQLLALKPGHAEAQNKLRLVRQRQDAENFYRQGCDAAQAGRWREAVDDLQRARGICGNFKDIEKRLTQAQIALDKETGIRAAPPPPAIGVPRAASSATPPPSLTSQAVPPRPPVPQTVPAQAAPAHHAAPWQTAPAQVAKPTSNNWLWAVAGVVATFVILMIIGFAMEQGGKKTPSDTHVSADPGPAKTDTADTTKKVVDDQKEAADARAEEKVDAPRANKTRVAKKPAVVVVPVAPPPAARHVEVRPAEVQPPEVKIEDQIIEKYLVATGGSAAWGALRSRLVTGTYTMLPANITGRYTAYASVPNKSIEEYALPTGGFMRQGFDGAVAWTSDPQQGVKQLFGQEAMEAARDADFYGDFHLRQNYAAINYIGEQMLGTHATYMLQLVPPTGNPRTVYVDKSTGLARRVDGVQPGAQGGTPVQVYLEDYRVVDGIRIPFRTRQITSQFTMVTQIIQIKHNVAVNDSIFRKPLAP